MCKTTRMSLQTSSQMLQIIAKNVADPDFHTTFLINGISLLSVSGRHFYTDNRINEMLFHFKLNCHSGMPNYRLLFFPITAPLLA